MSYKWCVVPACPNTSIKTPDKLFVCVPQNAKIRKKWLQLARRNPGDIAEKSSVFFCEDHFDMEKDMANYCRYKMGFSQRIIMVDGVLPSKFHCQQDRRKRMSDAGTSRPAFVKRQKKRLIQECLDIQPTATVQEVLISETHGADTNSEAHMTTEGAVNTGFNCSGEHRETSKRKYEMMNFSEIKQEPSNIPQSGGAHQASTDTMDSQSYIKQEESCTNQGDALPTPFHPMNNGFTNTIALLSCHVKTEPACEEDKEDCELKTTVDYSFDIHIKQEMVERDVVDDYIMQGEVDQVKISDNEEGGEEMNDHKTTFPDLTTLKPTMNDKLPLAVQDSNNSEHGTVSNTIGEKSKQNHHCRIDNKKQIFQKDARKTLYFAKKQNTCSVCGKVFKTSQACLWHMWRTHTGGGSYYCKLCKQTFQCQNDLKYHQISHSNKRPYFCHLCQKTFSQKGSLQKHKVCHSNERPYACDLCDKTFARKRNLEQHKACHSNERPYACDLCGKTFSRKSNLQQHKACHSNERPYACNLCEKTFTRKSNLQKHKACHSNERTYACSFCEKTFSQKSGLQQHKACHSNERSYACDLCEKTFTQKGSLQKHKISSHSNERLYSCDLCKKSFKFKDTIRKHMISYHSNERPYPCNLCEKTFAQKSHLQEHKACHSNERPYACDLCDKTFARKSILQQHKVCHSNERPYACNLCEKTFTRKENLQNHKIGSHSKEKPHLGAV